MQADPARCHSERSEESPSRAIETLQCVQGDMGQAFPEAQTVLLGCDSVVAFSFREGP
jgi:hypothetical protein